jgi:hypothetical protein
MPGVFLLIEGDDDERFFDKVVKPIAEQRYCWVRPWKYAQKKRKRIVGLLRSARSMGADFIYVRDFDGATCISARKEQIQEQLGALMPAEKIIIVVQEIESWYLAGVDERSCDTLGFSGLGSSTDKVTKETFERLRPPSMSRIALLGQLLADFDVDTAVRRNASFGYFATNWLAAPRGAWQ